MINSCRGFHPCVFRLEPRVCCAISTLAQAATEGSQQWIIVDRYPNSALGAPTPAPAITRFRWMDIRGPEQFVARGQDLVVLVGQ